MTYEPFPLLIGPKYKYLTSSRMSSLFSSSRLGKVIIFAKMSLQFIRKKWGHIMSNIKIYQINIIHLMRAFICMSFFSITGCMNPETYASGAKPPPVEIQEPLPWEAVHPESETWSAHVREHLRTDYQNIVNDAADMKDFCPQYPHLTDEQRLTATATLIAGITRFESNFKPTRRYRETTMGTDPVTGQQVYSEGLMQLSYQDSRVWDFCKFDWQKDRKLAATDPRKTILHPLINLSCGIGILSQQIRRHGRITLGKGAYWAVIKTNNKRNQIAEIKKIVRELPYCVQPAP